MQFASNEAFFAEVRAMIAELESAGQQTAAARLREGSSALNGLTDGWATLLKAVTDARNQCSETPWLAERLGNLEAHAYRAVYRRPMPPWTRLLRHWQTRRK